MRAFNSFREGGAIKLKFADKLLFLLDSNRKFCLHISVKRLVTSPKLLSTSHGQQHFFCLKVHCFVFSGSEAQLFGLFDLQNIGPLMQPCQNVFSCGDILVFS
jgi:hypothetical protein